MALERHLEENCAQHLTLVGALANRQQQQLTTLKAALARLSLNYTGTLIWKISDWAAKMNDAKSKDGMELVSPPFYTSQYGYKLQVKNIFKIYLKPYFNSIIHFIFFSTGFFVLERKRSWRIHTHVDVHQNITRRIRCFAALAFLSLRFFHTLRSDPMYRKSLQHRRKLHSRSHLEKLPKAQQRTGYTRIRFPQICFSRNDQEGTFRKGRCDVFENQSEPEQNCSSLIII